MTDGPLTGQLVVVDLYGTLLDADTPSAAWHRLADAYRRWSGAPDDEVERVVSGAFARLAAVVDPTVLVQENVIAAVAAVIAAEGRQPDEEGLCGVLWETLGTTAASYRARDGAIAFLDGLVGRGAEVRSLSVTILPPVLMDRVLDDLGLLPYLGQRHHSSAGGPKKPAPDAFLTAAAGDWASISMVGDDLELDLVPARALGWRTFDVGTMTFDEIAARLLADWRSRPGAV